VPAGRPATTEEPIVTKYLAILVGVLLLALTACDGDNGNGDTDDGNGNGDAAANGDSAEVDVVMDDMFFDPDEIEVPAGSELVVNLSNEGQLEHDFVIDGVVDTEDFQAGESGTADVGAVDEDMTAYCSVPGHRESGMEMEIIAGS
jgi:nitrite reductase (NO-forming)